MKRVTRVVRRAVTIAVAIAVAIAVVTVMMTVDVTRPMCESVVSRSQTAALLMQPPIPLPTRLKGVGREVAQALRGIQQLQELQETQIGVMVEAAEVSVRAAAVRAAKVAQVSLYCSITPKPRRKIELSLSPLVATATATIQSIPTADVLQPTTAAAAPALGINE